MHLQVSAELADWNRAWITVDSRRALAAPASYRFGNRSDSPSRHPSYGPDGMIECTTMTVLPNIRARLVQRYVFNFRIPPAELERRLPPWLTGQIIDGHCAGSFCILDLDHVTFGPVPETLGLRNINCALRFGVIDRQNGAAAVYVAERNTNSRLGAFITSLGFPGEHRHVGATITGDERAGFKLQVSEGRQLLFGAHAKRQLAFRSSLFGSLDAFAVFMAGGVRSYCPAKNDGQFNVVDLHKDDQTYEPLEVSALEPHILAEWTAGDPALSFDSAVRTSGGRYVWEYLGQRQK